MTLGTYLLLLLLTNIPSVQRWTAVRLARWLSDELHARVEMSNVRLGLVNRVVIDDVLLHDRSGHPLLQAARLSAKIDLLQLVDQRVRLSSVQLYGYDIRLRREAPDSAYNFQFVIDHFATTDTAAASPLDLAIRSVVVRRGTLRHDLLWMPRRDGFDPNHIQLRNLSLKASLNVLTPDSIDVDVSRLTFHEMYSRTSLTDLSLHLSANATQCRLAHLDMRLPQSSLRIPELRATYVLPDSSQTLAQWLPLVDAEADIHLSLTPSDLAPFMPALRRHTDPLTLATRAALHGGRLALSDVALRGPGLHLDAEFAFTLTPAFAASATVDRLAVSAAAAADILATLADEPDANPVPPAVAAALQRLGDVELRAQGSYSKAMAQADAELHTEAGSAAVVATLVDGDALRAHVETTDLRPSIVADTVPLGIDHVNLVADVEGSIRRRQAGGQAEVVGLSVAGRNIAHAHLDAALTPTHIDAALLVDDDEVAFNATASLQDSRGIYINLPRLVTIQAEAVVRDLRLALGGRRLHLGQLALRNSVDSLGQHMKLTADCIDARADGRFTPATLAATVRHILHRALPTVVTMAPQLPDAPSADEIDFSIHLHDADPLLAFAGAGVRLPRPATLTGRLSGPGRTMQLQADLEHVQLGGQNLTDIHLTATAQADSIALNLGLQRQMEAGPVSLALGCGAAADCLHTTLAWDTHRTPTLHGRLAARTAFARDDGGRLGAYVSVLPTELNISDTIWHVRPAIVNVHDGSVAVIGFEAAAEGRHLRIDGRAGAAATDTLYATLKDIELQYVFNLIDFHDVEIAGQASGTVAAYNLFASPKVDADIRVPAVHLNYGSLGNLHVLGGFGRRGPTTIDLDGYIDDPRTHLITRVNGLVTPGHSPESGIDLNIFANRTDIYFINFFTEGILDDLQGQATGYARLYGHFGQLNLQGDVRIDSADVSIPTLGTRYTLVGDSVHLRPDRFFFDGVRARDRHYGTDRRDHYALVGGEVRHTHFDDIAYDIRVEAHDCLAYDFREFGEQTFYGTVFADGNVHVYGRKGSLTCDISGHPTRGTTFTYNVSSPEAITDNAFITYTSRADTAAAHAAATVAAPAATPEADMRLNFDLDIGQEAEMRLLMDARSDDYITLRGDGRIRAGFYNKGAFQMYGTYRVDRGVYRLSLQDVIRKDFRFEQGSTITFGGQPMKGDLRLRALYTVPSVSLNDLAVGSNFSSSNVRVNCIMNITGQAERPQISFDFDIPNVNDDEKQMVRSLISTDEERNLQVIYLLGIGRFYTYGLDAAQNQASTAVNSLLSTTLSGQLNNLLTSAIGNAASNWNFGTSLSTGNMGWSSVDVEGMLSGRLLNNRLLINGTFGYRDTPVANTNFIGDFDVQWLLTPSGNIRLKAYSETNDRYFTKSALTTQGVGIQLRKDFNTLRDLFRRR